MKITANRLEILVDGGYREFTEKEVASALEKQIPKKVVKGKIIIGNDYCPVCHYFVQPPCEKHCSHCGQALDWGDSE